MSARNTLEAKRARRARKVFRKELPQYIDLFHWIKTRSNLTTGECHKVIMAGVLRVDSHRIGVVTDKYGNKQLQRYVPAHLNTKITINRPDAS